MSYGKEEKERVRVARMMDKDRQEKWRKQAADRANKGWADKRLNCMKELGWALWYMDYRFPEDSANMFRGQRKRVHLLCKEVSENQDVVSLAYWEHMWEKITDEIENMC